MNACVKCGASFPNRIKMDGKIRNISKRKFCLSCSPWGKHNTKSVLFNSPPTGMKRCLKCLSIKPLGEFFQRHPYCKSCLIKYQHDAAVEKKRRMVKMLGGKCMRCRYNRCLAAMEFHHLDPSQKEIEPARLIKLSWPKVVRELKKCCLLCSVCHKEEHAAIELFNVVPTIKTMLDKPVLAPTGKCPHCGTEVFGTIHCSTACSAASRRKVKRPTRERLVNELRSMTRIAIAEKYGVRDNAIKKWMACYGITDGETENGDPARTPTGN